MTPSEQLKVDALIEGIKEFGRVVVVAGVSGALVAATAYVTSIHDVMLQIVATTVLAAVVKAWDKKVHTDPTTDRSGVVPF